MRERLQCDIILRGGIASGLVYPGAISKLAETYDFRSIGGSSAGAIAASWTAAAALGAKRNPDIFQTTIKTHPQELARTDNGKTVYERLFQPQPGTRRLFNLFIASLRGKSPVPRAGRVFLGLFAEYPLFALAGAMLVLVPFMTLSLAKGSSGWTHVILVASSLVLVGLLAATFSLLAASGAAVRDIIVEIPKNRFGLCSGSSDGIPDSRDVLPLTDWLHNFLQRLADRPFDQPVTFGDLWNTDGN